MSVTGTVRFSLRLPADVLDRVAEVRGRRSLNAEIVARLEESLARGAEGFSPSTAAVSGPQAAATQDSA